MNLLSRLRARLPERRNCVALGLLVLVGLALDFIYFSGFFASDDVSYLRAARHIGTLGDQPADFAWTESFATIRLGITAPDGLVYWLSGGSIATIAWFHVLYHVALIVLAYAIGREVWDESTGIAGAGLVATSPVLYLYAGGVLPDNATAVWLALLVLLLLRIRRRAQERPLTWRESAPSHLFAGFVLGVAYACKETAIIMTVPSAIVIMASAPRLRSWTWVRDGAFFAAGLLVFMLCEAVVLYLLTDEWRSRLTGFQSSRDPFAERMKVQGTLPHDRFAFLAGRFRLTMPLSALVLLGGALASLFLRRRRDVALLAFCWWPVLYLTIGSTSFDAYRPSSLQERYYAIAIVPAAVMAAVAVRVAIERWPMRGWARRAAVAAFIAIVLFEARYDIWFAGRAYHTDEGRGFTLAYEAARVRYPAYPILLSRDYQRRMQPLLFPGDPDPAPATAPFVLLSPVAEALPEGINRIRGFKAQDLYVRTVDILYAPQRRWDVLVDGARGWFGVGARAPVPTDARSGAVIQLVTTAAGDEPPPYQRLPLFPLTGEVAVTSLDGGNHVAWSGAQKLVLQLFDSKGWRATPVHPAAQLAAHAKQVRVELDLTAGRTTAAIARLIARGYDADGRFVQVEQQVDLASASPSATAAVELEAATPFVAVRLRVKVTARAGGTLYVGNPRYSITQ